MIIGVVDNANKLDSVLSSSDCTETSKTFFLAQLAMQASHEQ